jgi:hypothetical protein
VLACEGFAVTGLQLSRRCAISDENSIGKVERVTTQTGFRILSLGVVATLLLACGSTHPGTGGNGGNGGGGGDPGSEDMSTPPDLAPLPTGACLDATDQAIGKMAMSSAASSCGVACFVNYKITHMGTKPCSDCLQTNIQTATGKMLSAGCNLCWTNVIVCGIDHCQTQCQSDPNAPGCRSCTMAAGCDAAFSTCSGGI